MFEDASHTLKMNCASGLRYLLILSAVTASANRVYAQGFGGPARVEVAVVEERQVAPSVRLVGSVTARKRSLIASEVEGFVLEFPVDVGDHVRQGDLLCKLRDNPQRFGRDEAAARVAELRAAVEVQRADLKRWDYEQGRMSRLHDQGQGAEKEAIDATASYESGKARVTQAESSLKAAEAVLARMQYELDRTEVRAPFDGYVVSKMTEIGSWVTKGGGVIELIDLSTARIRVNVPETYIAFNTIGAQASIFVDALGRSFEGSVARVVPDADMQARTFPVDIDIPNPEAELKAGMFIRGNVPAGPVEHLVVVPKNAVVTRGPISYLFVVKKTPEGFAADMRQVRVVSELLDHVAVEVDGLAAGDQVVIRGNEGMMGPGPVIIMSSELKPGETATTQPASTMPAATEPIADPARGGADQPSSPPANSTADAAKDSHRG